MIRSRQRPTETSDEQLLELLRDHKKWWLTPVVLALLVLCLFALLSTSAAAPFIYTLF